MTTTLCEWGSAGIEALRGRVAVFVIVDVLSFSTAVNVAIERGAGVIRSPMAILLRLRPQLPGWEPLLLARGARAVLS